MFDSDKHGRQKSLYKRFEVQSTLDLLFFISKQFFDADLAPILF
jgi:hypothetical protein